ncbi:MAG: hypothetical protein LUD22_02785 [Coprobacillus sp.]|nr:hypothetical protein [Coprobacillus sp.]
MTEDFLKEYTRNDYQIDNFTDFINKVKFEFNVPAIHIAGTNGKGSTAHFLSSIYQEAGLKVGLYMSPFTKEINEMITINGERISDDDFLKYYNQHESLFKKYDLSKFEIETFIMFSYFKDQNLDLAIIECGMGGEEDATNIFTPILSIITTVSLEHTEELGQTTSEITLSKSGIIKYEVPVVVGSKFNEDDLSLLSNICKKNRTTLHVTTDYHNASLDEEGYTFTYYTYKDVKIRFSAYYSIEDASIALEAVRVLMDRIPVTETQVRNGLLNMELPLRMEKVRDNPTVILDGAHNLEACENLAKSIESYAKGKPIHIIFACFKDKDVSGMLQALNLVSDDLTMTTFPHIRARGERELFFFMEEYQYKGDYKALINEKIEQYPDDIILVTGSLAFVGLVKDMFDD